MKRIIEKIQAGYLLEVWEEIKWMWPYARRYWPAIVYYIVLGIIGTAMGFAGSLASKELIDVVTGYRTRDLQLLIVFLLAMAGGSILMSAATSRISAKISVWVQNELQAEVYSEIMVTDWESLHKFRSGDLLNRLNGDVGAVAGSVIGWVPSLITRLFQFVGALAIILYYDATMAWIALASAPVSLLLSNLLMRRMRDYNQKVRKMSSEIMSFQEDSFQHLQSIKAFNLTDFFSDRMLGYQEAYREMYLDYNKFSIATSSFMSVVGTVISYACFGWGVYRLWSGMITYGTMTLFLQMAGSLKGSFSSLVSMVPSTISAATSAGRVMEVVGLPREQIRDEDRAARMIEKATGVPAEETLALLSERSEPAESGEEDDGYDGYEEPSRLELRREEIRNAMAEARTSGRIGSGAYGNWISGRDNTGVERAAAAVRRRAGRRSDGVRAGVEVALDQVDFTYLDGTEVLAAAEFHASPSEIVALVGPSGEGKTTLVRILLGLVSPQSGSAVLRSDDAECMISAATRSLFSYVPQGNTMFAGTVAENMRMLKADATEEEMVAALRAAAAWEFVEKLPGGLDYVIGEQGNGLSEGQAQRIAIARALLREAPVLLLDEATSALDAVTERQVLANIMAAGRCRTCIVTTHRPSVLGMCDRIYQVKKTRVIPITEEEYYREYQNSAGSGEEADCREGEEDGRE